MELDLWHVLRRNRKELASRLNFPNRALQPLVVDIHDLPADTEVAIIILTLASTIVPTCMISIQRELHQGHNNQSEFLTARYDWRQSRDHETLSPERQLSLLHFLCCSGTTKCDTHGFLKLDK